MFTNYLGIEIDIISVKRFSVLNKRLKVKFVVSVTCGFHVTKSSIVSYLSPQDRHLLSSIAITAPAVWH